MWAEQMDVQNYSAAASVYTDDANLTVDGASYQGLAEIEAFFIILGNMTEKYDYDYGLCVFDHCSFKGQYDFGPGMKYVFEITLEESKIVKEVVTAAGI